jgi:uncharacterized sulfatase
MDERYDLVRSVRDRRFIYIRNYMPHKIYGQYIAYMFETPTTRVWKQLYDAGKLKPPQTYFWQTKPAEELYDLANDPDEVHNLAGSPQHQEILARLRKAQQEQIRRVRDVGFLQEAEIHSRAAGSTPYEVGHDDRRYPLKRILAAAELAAAPHPDGLAQLKEAFQDPDSAVRCWAALGVLIRGRAAVAAARGELLKAFADEAPSVRIPAAEALGRYGLVEDLDPALKILLQLAPLDKNGLYVSMAALNALDALGRNAAPGLPVIKDAAKGAEQLPPRLRAYIPGLVKKLVGELQK